MGEFPKQSNQRLISVLPLTDESVTNFSPHAAANGGQYKQNNGEGDIS